jgi:sulfate adenylyltransferase subunit 1 (EFTu-like GTPase family)
MCRGDVLTSGAVPLVSDQRCSSAGRWSARPTAENRDLGSFILIDPLRHRTAAAGMIDFSLRGATNIRWQTLDVDKSVRASLKQQRLQARRYL